MKTKIFTTFLALLSSAHVLPSHQIDTLFYKKYCVEIVFLLVGCNDGFQRGYYRSLDDCALPIDFTDRAIEQLVSTVTPLSYETAVEAFGMDKINHLYYTDSVTVPLPWTQPLQFYK